MNNFSRGGIRAMIQMLKTVDQMLDRLEDREAQKEDPWPGEGVSISSQHEVYADKIDDVRMDLEDIIERLEEYFPNKTDFE